MYGFGEVSMPIWKSMGLVQQTKYIRLTRIVSKSTTSVMYSGNTKEEFLTTEYARSFEFYDVNEGFLRGKGVNKEVRIVSRKTHSHG